MKNITFLNTCSPQEWASDRDKEFRFKANEYIISTLNNSSYLSEEDNISIKYYQKGVSSVVSQLIFEDGRKFVFKTSSRSSGLLSEVISLKKWKNVGIAVPTIHEIGENDEHVYYIMDYFDGLTYKDMLGNNLISPQQVGQIMGQVMFKMQKVTGVGFGFPFTEEANKLIGPTPTLNDYLEKEFLNKDKLNIISKEFPEVEWSKILQENIKCILKEYKEPISVLGNMDFGPQHFFAADNPTMFDPFPELVPKYFDVAFYLIPEQGRSERGSYLIRKATIDSYFSFEGKINIEILHSALWLLTYRKCGNLLHQTDESRTKRARYMLNLISNEQLLDKHIKLYVS